MGEKVASQNLVESDFAAMQKVKSRNHRRLVVLGSPNVGKSSIVRRFLKGNFQEAYVPTVEDFHRKVYQIRGEGYQLDILDTSGNGNFPARKMLSILTGNIFLLVFSLDNKQSLEEVCTLQQQITEAKRKLCKSKQDLFVPMVICGNKMDREAAAKEGTYKEVRETLSKQSVYFETSAKENINMEEMFQMLVKQAGLPPETTPSLHHKLSISSFQELKMVGGSRKDSDPCAVVFPYIRRPSISSDLQNIINMNLCKKKTKKLEKCHIQ
uniref:RASD family member 2a n=2 Tax=Latimeria chalumnae TaxID=7897 RepID=H3B3W1_LATCH